MNTIRQAAVLTLVFCVAAACQPASKPDGDGLTFIHLNDTYRIGAVESGNAGGFGRVVTIVREAQAEGRDVRILHGGDFLYPSLESQLWDGAQMVDAFNFMDAVAPMYVVAGNHEFDRRTPGPLIEAVRSSTFDWLGDNYGFETGDADIDSALERQFTFDHSGRKVGFFALTLHADDGGNARDYVPIDRDYEAAARQAIEAHRANGVDLIIGLTHLHVWQDEALAELKSEYPELLFVAGGHEHEPEFKSATETSAAVVKGASNARVVWRIDIEFGPDGEPTIAALESIELGSDVLPDPDYEQLNARWRGELLERFPFLEARVGEAAVTLDGREVTIRNVESNWGNFIVDQMRRAFGDELADLAFINSGTIRIDDVISGDITFEDIGRTFGFSSYLRYLTLTGEEFREVLEYGYRGAGPSKGYFPQVSGFRVCVNRDNPEGNRIVSLQVPAADGGWAEIGAKQPYRIVVPDFLYGGGDGYVFPDSSDASLEGSELKYLVLDAIMAAQARGERVGGTVDPDRPRIVILGPGRETCWP